MTTKTKLTIEEKVKLAQTHCLPGWHACRAFGIDMMCPGSRTPEYVSIYCGEERWRELRRKARQEQPEAQVRAVSRVYAAEECGLVFSALRAAGMRPCMDGKTSIVLR